MNVSSVKTKDYKNDNDFRLYENKPNSNPIKPNFKPTIFPVGFRRIRSGHQTTYKYNKCGLPIQTDRLKANLSLLKIIGYSADEVGLN